MVYTRGLKKYKISTYYVHLDTHKLGMHSNIYPEVGSPDYWKLNPSALLLLVYV